MLWPQCDNFLPPVLLCRSYVVKMDPWIPALASGRVLGWPCGQVVDQASELAFGWASGLHVVRELAGALTLVLAELAVGVHSLPLPAAHG